MCGIVGYIGRQQAQPILLAGLRQLEYRGYDSAGVAIFDGSALQVRKKAGEVDKLAQLIGDQPLTGTCGISHTRWATHGVADDTNAHPHTDHDQSVAVVHNGVIENYTELKAGLEKKGYQFVSKTDTEVIAHLVSMYLQHFLTHKHQAPKDALVAAVEHATQQLRGTYGIAVVSSLVPNVLIGARLGSPLVFGIAEHEYFLASDTAPLLPHTKKVVYLNDGDVVVATPDDFVIRQRTEEVAAPVITEIEWSIQDSDKGDFEHYMRKEIYEQPATIQNALRGRIDAGEATAKFGGLNLSTKELKGIKRIVLTACGTSWHAALFGEYLLEEVARIPVEVEYASELRYRNAPVEPGTALFCISQSGETADTLAAMREYKQRGMRTLGLVNVVGSAIAREADGGVYLHAGPEIGVASTKAFTAQLVVLTLLAVHLARLRHLTHKEGGTMLEALQGIPDLVQRTLTTETQIKEIAAKYHQTQTFLYMGRGYQFPVALEGALKLKEVSYIHAEGYPAAEMKHGPIALVDANTPTVIINPRSAIYDKVMSNLEEIKARGAPVIAIATEGDTEIATKADHVVYVPDAPDFLQPLLTVVPLQLLAYHIALLRGCNVDKPRNLAKSVTVE